MSSPDLQLVDLLSMEPQRGQIRLAQYRMALLSTAALGCLRKELIDTVGWDRARGLMKRFGFSAGEVDGRAMVTLFPDATPREKLRFGPALHALEGIARIVRDQGKTQVDLEKGIYHVEAYWENSYEAEQHLENFGRSKEPVCWTLAGYAKGHSSQAVGQETVVTETECRAMGHPRCRFVVSLATATPDLAARERDDYASHHIPEVMNNLLGTIQEQRKSLRASKRTIATLQSQLETEDASRPILGNSEALRKTLEVARRLAPVDTPVLVLGESGTGKELLARDLHERSMRQEQPFIAINCSALPESLQEAELFGHAKGAFTGASHASEGVFEAADKGTLFLDEVGDLSLSAQTKLLRVLPEGEIKRLGETRIRKVDVRIVAATHRDLSAMVREGSFREDLYYRLSVVTVTLPPLRDRGDDILLLAKHFVEKYSVQHFQRPGRLTRDAQCALRSYPWPGNVRELENAVQRGVILSTSEVVDAEDLPESVLQGANASPPTSAMTVAPVGSGADASLGLIEDESTRVQTALIRADGNRARAAAMLGTSRTTLWRRMKTLHLG